MDSNASSSPPSSRNVVADPSSTPVRPIGFSDSAEESSKNSVGDFDARPADQERHPKGKRKRTAYVYSPAGRVAC
jgi:hypothetical protein